MGIAICIHFKERNFLFTSLVSILSYCDLLGFIRASLVPGTIHQDAWVQAWFIIMIDPGISSLKGFLEESLWCILQTQKETEGVWLGWDHTVLAEKLEMAFQSPNFHVAAFPIMSSHQRKRRHNRHLSGERAPSSVSFLGLPAHKASGPLWQRRLAFWVALLWESI